jgi:hypothetical protein
LIIIESAPYILLKVINFYLAVKFNNSIIFDYNSHSFPVRVKTKKIEQLYSPLFSLDIEHYHILLSSEVLKAESTGCIYQSDFVGGHSLVNNVTFLLFVIYDAFVSGAQNHEKLIKQVVF